MQSSISIELHRSRLLDALIACGHLVAFGCVIALPFSGSLRMLIGGLLFASCWRAFRRVNFHRLQLTESEIGLAMGAANSRVEAKLLPDTRVFRFLIVLSLLYAQDQRRFFVVLLPDQLSPSDFRRLSVWLLWRIKAGATNGGE